MLPRLLKVREIPRTFGKWSAECCRHASTTVCLCVSICVRARSPVLVAHSTLHKPLTMRLLTSPPKDVRETDGKSNGGGERKKKNLRWRPFENRKPRSHVCVESLFLEGDSQLVLHLVLSQPCLLCLFLVLSPIYLYVYIYSYIYLSTSVGLPSFFLHATHVHCFPFWSVQQFFFQIFCLWFF